MVDLKDGVNLENVMSPAVEGFRSEFDIVMSLYQSMGVWSSQYIYWLMITKSIYL